MTPIPFRTNPAFTTLGDALELAVAHLRANPVIWGVPTIIYTLVAGALTWAFTERFSALLSPSASRDPASLERMGQAFVDNLPAFIGFGVLLAIGGVALYWVAMALAVGGLPGRAMTADQAVGAGLRSIGLGILVVVVAIPILIAVTAVMIGAFRGDAGWLLLVLVPATFVAFAYVAIRLTFSMCAVFDGVGIFDSLRMSWRLSKGGMLRIVGWLFALAAISVVIGIASNLAGAAFATTLAVVGVLLGTAVSAVFQFYQLTVLAILYESQRMRHAFASPGMPVLPGGPVGPAQPPAPADPLLPPPPPAW